MKINKLRLIDKNLCVLISGEDFKSKEEFLDVIALCLNQGVDIITLCGLSYSAKDFLEVCKRARELCSIYNALLIVQDRLDIAHISCSDGVCLSNNDIDFNTARNYLENNYILGCIVEDVFQAIDKQACGADYLIFDCEVNKINIEKIRKNINIPYYINYFADDDFQNNRFFVKYNGIKNVDFIDVLKKIKNNKKNA